MGHMPFGLHAFLPQPARYFTILRDPVERVVSHYYFLRHSSSSLSAQRSDLSDLTLQSFIEHQTTREARNLQTRLISGVVNQKATKINDEEILARAKKNLQESFDVVGLAEHFDETLLLLKNAFRWRQVFYVKLNVIRSRPQQNEILPATRQLIQEHNQLDLELYRYARMLFAEQLQRQDAIFTQQLRSFQTYNRLLQPFLHIWWRAPHAVNRVVRQVRKRLSAPRTA